MRHELKILTAHMDSVLEGAKRFEIRNNFDRGFQGGDLILLKEWIPDEVVPGLGAYGKRTFSGIITYVTNFAQQPDVVVFGFEEKPGVVQ